MRLINKIIEILLFKNGFWTSIAKIKFILRDISYGNNLKVFGPIFIRKEKDTKIEILDNVRILPNVEFKCRNNGSIFLSNNVQIDSFTRLVAAHEKIFLDDDVHLGPFCILNGGKTISIGKNTITSGYCMLSSTEHYLSDKNNSFDGNYNYGSINIGENCWIGSHAVILPNINIGNQSIIGTLSMIKSDVESNSIYAGVPAKFIKKVEFND